MLCLAAVLWLVWGFLTRPVAGKAILTLVVLLVAGMLARRRYRQQQPVQLADEAGIFPARQSYRTGGAGLRGCG